MQPPKHNHPIPDDDTKIDLMLFGTTPPFREIDSWTPEFAVHVMYQAATTDPEQSPEHRFMQRQLAWYALHWLSRTEDPQWKAIADEYGDLPWINNIGHMVATLRGLVSLSILHPDHVHVEPLRRYLADPNDLTLYPCVRCHAPIAERTIRDGFERLLLPTPTFGPHTRCRVYTVDCRACDTTSRIAIDPDGEFYLLEPGDEGIPYTGDDPEQ